MIKVRPMGHLKYPSLFGYKNKIFIKLIFYTKSEFK
jgi:hypothetical protein